MADPNEHAAKEIEGSEEDAILTEAKEAFTLASDYEQENRKLAEVDLRFSRLGDQWDTEVLRQRKEQGRPAAGTHLSRAVKYYRSRANIGQ